MGQSSSSILPAGVVLPTGTDGLVWLTVRIGCIVFAVEAAIMLVFHEWDSKVTLTESFIDAVLLTVITGPIIYHWVARPFADDAANARQALAQQLREARGLLDEKARLSRSVQQFSKVSADIYDRTLQRIGADLHDGPAQFLTFALLQLSRFERAFEDLNEPSRAEEAREVHRIIQQTVEEIRGIAMGFALPELRDLSVQDVVELAARRHRQSTGVKAETVIAPCPPVSLSHRAAIYRFVQESLANAYKHSAAETVRVCVECEPQLTIKVIDDGKGFDPSAVANRGLGLTGMQARMGALFGQLDVKSAPGAGTELTAHFGTNLTADGEIN